MGKRGAKPKFGGGRKSKLTDEQIKELRTFEKYYQK
jgi:transposase